MLLIMPACSKSLEKKDEKKHCSVLITAYSQKDWKVCRGKWWLPIAWVHKEGILVVPQTAEEQSQGSLFSFIHLNAMDIYSQSLVNSFN